MVPSKWNRKARQTRKVRNAASEGPDHSLDPEAPPAEIEQQTETQTRGLEVIQALRAMNVVDRPGDLQFHYRYVFPERVHNVVPGYGIIIANHRAMLLRNRDPGFAQLIHQGVFMDFLKEPGPSMHMTIKAQPMICLDSASSRS